MTISTHQLPQSDPPLSAQLALPTMYDLPSEDPEEPGLPDEFHFYQSDLLLKTFLPTNWSLNMVFSACDLNLYYDVRHTNWYKRPDWFGVVGVSRLYEGSELRLSYVIWQEQVSPFIVVELLSPGTEDEDLGEVASQFGSPPPKWEVYEQILRVPYYVVFSRYTNELRIFHLVSDRYELVELTNGRLQLPEIGLSLGLWQGSYQGVNRLWLRWFTLEGDLIPTSSEQAAAAQQETAAAQQEAVAAQQETAAAQQEAAAAQQETAAAQQETAAAQQETAAAQQRAERLAAKLRELGIDPNELLS